MRLTAVSHSANSQRGAVVIMTAGFMLLGVLFLALAVDTGRLYMEKRNLQRVADVVALELASTEWCANGAPGGEATIALNRNIPAGASIVFKSGSPKCGTVDDGVPRVFTPDADGNAVQVEVIHSVAKSLVAGGYFSSDPNVDLWAVAVASRGGDPLAALVIRSTLVNVNEGLLNSLVGGLLGGSVSLTAASWEGLLDTNIVLLDFLDELKLRLGISAGGYDQVLNTSVTLGEILDVAADVLPADAGAVQASLGMLGQSIGADVAPIGIKLSDILDVQTGDGAGADIKTSLFGLVQGSIMLANKESPVVVNNLQVGLPGLLGVSINLKVIEPPRVSAIGNPAEAKLNPLGDAKIYVQTAQVRLMVSLNLPALSIATNLLNSLGNLVFDLLGALLGGLLGGTPHIQIVPSPRIDLSLDIGGASAHVTDFSCESGGEKMLTAAADTAVAVLRIGDMSKGAGGSAAQKAAAAKINAFSSSEPPTVDPIAIIDIGSRNCVLGICGPRTPFAGGGLGLMLDVPVAKTSAPSLVYLVDSPPDDSGNLPEVKLMPETEGYKKISGGNVVSSLQGTLNGIEIQAFQPQPGQNNLLGGVLGLVGAAFTSIKGIVNPLISGLLSPLLDPLLNSLLKDVLGLSLAEADVGGFLTCNSEEGVRLVN